MKLSFIEKCYVTGCFLGYYPVAPATVASLFTIFLYFAISNLSPLYYLSIIILMFIIAIPVVTKAEKYFGKKDSKEIVIDEVVGVLVTMFMIPEFKLGAVLGFFLFRFFDILKIWPASKIEKIEGGLGVMLDDIIAGIYANITIRIILLVLKYL